MEEVKAPFAQWAIVELMGHNVIAGHVSEQTIAGVGFLRVDVPAVGENAEFTKFFAPSAIYGITPTSEANARLAASRLEVRPVSLYILPDPERPRRVAMIADREQEESDMDRVDDEGVDYGDNDEDDEEDEIGF